MLKTEEVFKKQLMMLKDIEVIYSSDLYVENPKDATRNGSANQ